jgi:hypothetical protein
LSSKKQYDQKIETNYLREKSLAFMLVLLGIFGGFFISLSANVINDMFGYSNTYKLIILILTFIFIASSIGFVQKLFVKPLKKLEKTKRNK